MAEGRGRRSRSPRIPPGAERGRFEGPENAADSAIAAVSAVTVSLAPHFRHRPTGKNRDTPPPPPPLPLPLSARSSLSPSVTVTAQRFHRAELGDPGRPRGFYERPR